MRTDFPRFTSSSLKHKTLDVQWRLFKKNATRKGVKVKSISAKIVRGMSVVILYTKLSNK